MWFLDNENFGTKVERLLTIRAPFVESHGDDRCEDYICIVTWTLNNGSSMPAHSVLRRGPQETTVNILKPAAVKVVGDRKLL